MNYKLRLPTKEEIIRTQEDYKKRSNQTISWDTEYYRRDSAKGKRWSEREADFIKNKLVSGYTCKQIAELTGRTEITVSDFKCKFLKLYHLYNLDNHYSYKQALNLEAIQVLGVRTVLDLYAGLESSYSKYCRVTSNDKFVDGHTYQMDAEMLVKKLELTNEAWDYIDADPFGNCRSIWEFIVDRSLKGFSIGLGDFYLSKFYKRTKHVQRVYGLQSYKDLTIDSVVNIIKELGHRYGKKIRLYKAGEFTEGKGRGFLKLYFEILKQNRRAA